MGLKESTNTTKLHSLCTSTEHKVERLAPCKRIRNLESSKCLLLESGIQNPEDWNPESTMAWNPESTMVWNPESTMLWIPESRKLESRIQKPGSRMQDLHGFSYMGRNVYTLVLDVIQDACLHTRSRHNLHTCSRRNTSTLSTHSFYT